MGIFKKKIQLKITEQENGAVVFDKTHGIYFQTNSVGTCILKMISESKSVNEIIDEIAVKFKIEKKQSEEDVTEFIETLKKAGIV